MQKDAENDADFVQIDRWAEDLTFYGYKKIPEGSWMNSYNSVVVQLASIDNVGIGHIHAGNASCSISFDLSMVPEIARRLAEALLFADESYIKERYGDIPHIVPSVLPHIFHGMELKKDGVKDRAIAEALAQEFFKLSEAQVSSPEIWKLHLDMSLGFLFKNEEISVALAIMPTGIDDSGFTYTISPLAIDILKKLIYGVG